MENLLSPNDFSFLSGYDMFGSNVFCLKYRIFSCVGSKYFLLYALNIRNIIVFFYSYQDIYITFYLWGYLLQLIFWDWLHWRLLQKLSTFFDCERNFSLRLHLSCSLRLLHSDFFKCNFILKWMIVGYFYIEHFLYNESNISCVNFICKIMFLC